MKLPRTAALLAGLLTLCAAPSFAQTTARPWQSLQNPTAAEVLAAWKTPPSGYGPELY